MPDFRAEITGTQTMRSEPTAAAVQSATGSYKGAEVTLIDANSLIADAAEELTSTLSETVEKDVSEREVEDGRKADRLDRLMKLTTVQKLFGKLPDLDQKALFRGLKTLLQQQALNARDIRERARQEFGEPAHQYALLQALVEHLKSNGGSDAQLKAAQDALDSLMAEEGPSIRAALNIAEVAEGFVGGPLGDLQALRDGYRSNIQDYQNMTTVLSDLTDRYGNHNLKEAIGFMIKSLSADMSSEGPSTDRTKLGVIVNDLHRLEVLSTVLDNCNRLAETARRLGARKSFTGTAILRDTIPLQDTNWIKTSQISAIPENGGLKEAEHQIRFLNEYQELVRMIPIKSYQTPENREKLMTAVQDAIDQAVAREEAELDNDDW